MSGARQRSVQGQTGQNLLVVDWDFFFVNPMESSNQVTGHDFLYDWGHNESMSLMLDGIWGARKHSFEMAGEGLPGMDRRWRKFANRFNVADSAVIKYADSNLWAGSDEYFGADYDYVWLFDAHHDLYRYDTLDEWRSGTSTDRGTQITCEDWMFWHAWNGAQLMWRFPDWHEAWSTVKRDDDLAVARNLHVGWRADDWKQVRTPFTDVFVCRSGGWVPPWCDDEFDEFLLTWGRDIEQIGPEVDMTRTAWKQTASMPQAM